MLYMSTTLNVFRLKHFQTIKIGYFGSATGIFNTLLGSIKEQITDIHYAPNNDHSCPTFWST